MSARGQPAPGPIGRICLARDAHPALALILTLGACVTEESVDSLDPLAVQPVILGRVEGDAQSSASAAYYSSVLAQMQAAAAEREPEHLRQLLDLHDRPGVPGWVEQRMSGFKLQVPVLEFERHVEFSAAIEVVGEVPALGEAMLFQFAIPPAPLKQVVLFSGSSVDSARFLARIRIREFDCYGSVSDWSTSSLVVLPEDVRIAGSSGLRFPLELEALPSDGAYREVRIEVDWMPGYLQLGRDRVSNSRVAATHEELKSYPLGVESVRRAPLTTMRNALRLGDEAHFNHIFLAAHFMPEDLWREAQELLIAPIRLQGPDLARVCMASLALISDADLAVDDRQGWLRWWGKQEGR